MNPLIRKIRPTVLQPQGRHHIQLSGPDHQKAKNKAHFWFVAEWLSLFAVVVGLLAWVSTDDRHWQIVWTTTTAAALIMSVYCKRRTYHYDRQTRSDRWKDATPR